MWQISCPPTIVALLGYYIFGYLHDFGQVGGSNNHPKMYQFGNNSTIFCTKCKLKGGLFHAKERQLVYLGFTMLAVLDKWRCLPMGPYCTKLKGGPFYEKMTTHVFGGPTMQAVSDKWGCLPIGPKSFAKSKLKGSLFYDIICHLFLGPHAVSHFG